MRVVGGELRGRIFQAPTGHVTHPMSERIRNALFNTLGDLRGLSILDAYGGSGALAIEAVSRGAAEVSVTEVNAKAFRIIEDNVTQLKLEDRVKVSKANCVSWLSNTGKMFDLILVDPPFGEASETHMEQFAQHLNINGIMVLSHPGRTDAPRVDGVVVVKHRNYGNAALTFYRREA